MISVRTDLAIEAKQAYTEENKRELDGVKVDEEMEGEEVSMCRALRR